MWSERGRCGKFLALLLMVLVLAFAAPAMRTITLVSIIGVTLQPMRSVASTRCDDFQHSTTVTNETGNRARHLRAEYCENAKHENKTHKW